ncbi:tat pathway signal sequence [Aspergillus costaricaensis CBS 115574]|uniref:Tat pathway signal sequence n=1 Tax=Aspergillus costaricaensis CBS 115574 TaxID=1448317 RepID=A0ACD1I9U6_9EURO|nr:tat pathway signal sequence [Aspergillus costaricaensis CBS 115574]RAK87090.1 tat pathway signal sequence [Aspergillus costaricaensis CBS 115574]
MLAVAYLWILLLLRGIHVGAKSTTSTREAEVTTITDDDSTASASSTHSGTGSDSFSVVTTETAVAVPTGSYLSYTTTITVGDSVSQTTFTTTTAANTTISTNGTTTATTTTDTNVVVTGTRNSSSTATSTATTPANSQPCNGYTEFCSRQYSNITMVTAHNSPFVKKNNIAANQMYKVKTQLEDGVRMLSFEAHYYEDDIYLCHSSCDLLNMGTLEDYLTTVTDWIKDNPYDVVTILIVNSDYVSPWNFTAPIENSGLIDYVYEPWKIPMSLDDWPTLSEMILDGKRAVVFMDYQANQTAIPYILDEFTQMWETPFSPLNTSFPCTVQRPPGITAAQAEERMYMINHNLNLEIVFEGIDILVPDSAQINETNAVSGYGSLGLMANNCRAKWDRPPNFLLVDYYNDGNFQGSVFEVAAQMNNVTYNGKCCGGSSSAASRIVDVSYTWLSAFVAMGVGLFTLFGL